MRTLHMLLVLASLAFVGCGNHFAITAHPNFATLQEVDRNGFQMRATTADGVVIGVREIENETHANQAFWVRAIRNRVERTNGYALVSESEVRTTHGEAGLQLRFGRDYNNTTYDYWLTLFVTNDRIFIIEAGGVRTRFEAERANVEASIASFHPT
jgi:hypothetical protein